MSYENVEQKINQLEQKGYLNKGDHSVEYLTMNKEILCRFFNDTLSDEVRKHLKKKLRTFLENENVVFKLGYSLTVLPSEKLSKIINESTSYTQMSMELQKLPFVNVRECTTEYVKIAFTSNGRSFDLYSKDLSYVVSDDIILTDVTSNYGVDIIIKSTNCSVEDDLKEIDSLFD